MYRQKRNVTVSEEYLDDLGGWLKEWASKKDSMILAQFCSKYGIGFSYLKHFTFLSQQFGNIYEVAIATLCERWLDYAMKTKNMPQHMQKVIMKYLRAYDHHSFDMEMEAKKEVAREETLSSITNYVAEDYSKEKLEGVYKQFYDQNVNKRRSR